MTQKPKKIELESYLERLAEKGINVQEAKAYLERIISSNVSKPPREVQ